MQDTQHYELEEKEILGLILLVIIKLNLPMQILEICDYYLSEIISK